MPLANHISADAGLRAAVIEHYQQRRAVAIRRGDTEQAQFLGARIGDLKSGRAIQMTHNEIPRKHRPEQFSPLYELRGDYLVPVATWQPQAERPAEWTI